MSHEATFSFRQLSTRAGRSAAPRERPLALKRANRVCVRTAPDAANIAVIHRRVNVPRNRSFSDTARGHWAHPLAVRSRRF